MKKFLLIIGSILLGVKTLSSASAQTITVLPGWQVPQQIPGQDDDAGVPYLVVDQNRTIHALNSKLVDDRVAIVYSRWSMGQGWTMPVDILLSPLKNQARIRGAHLDDEGIMHLIFFGGDDLGANIYYANALAREANSPTAWSEPVNIGPAAVTPTTAAIVGEGSNLYVVYSGGRDGIGLYSTESTDGGSTWSTASVFFLTYDITVRAASLQLYISGQGQPHIVWSVVDVTGNGQAVFYANLDTETMHWTEPYVLAARMGFEADTPQIVEYLEELFVVYHNDFPTTRWMQRSQDGGRNWSEPERLFAQVGSNGAVSFVIDQTDTLHMFFGNRIGNPATHAVWHSIWKGDKWSDPIAIMSGPRVADEPGGSGFDPSFVQATISQGNTMFLAWETDPGAGQNGIWYTFTTLDLPETAVEELPGMEIETVSSVTEAVEATAVPQPTTKVTFIEQADSPELITNPTWPLLVGVVPVTALLLGTFLFFNSRRSKQQF